MADRYSTKASLPGEKTCLDAAVLQTALYILSLCQEKSRADEGIDPLRGIHRVWDVSYNYRSLVLRQWKFPVRKIPGRLRKVMRFPALWRQLLDLLKQIKLIVIVRVIVRMIVIVIVRVEVYLSVAPGKHGFRGGERFAHPPMSIPCRHVFFSRFNKNLSEFL